MARQAGLIRGGASRSGHDPRCGGCGRLSEDRAGSKGENGKRQNSNEDENKALPLQFIFLQNKRSLEIQDSDVEDLGKLPINGVFLWVLLLGILPQL